MAARGYGRGSIIQRSDGLWVGRIEASTKPRRRITFGNKDRTVVEAKLDAWLAENRPHRKEPQPTNSREEHMRRARALGRHTAAQWRAKVAASGGLCYYCERPVALGGVKDHVVPVSRGGSDSIENVVLACWDCNDAKRDLDEADFREWAKETGFFHAPQHVTVSVNSRNRRIPASMAALMKVPRGERMEWIARQKQRREHEAARA